MGHHISPKQLEANGWRRLPNKGGRVRFGRDFQHSAGWRIEHCGHPTALWPYLLIDPAGEVVLSGAAGPWRNPDYGTAWRTVEAAVNYVSSIGLPRRELLTICRWR